MLEKIKGNLAFAACAVMGVLNFIFFLIPYISLGFIDFNAYDILSNMWDANFSGVMCALVQLLTLFGTIAMLAVGVGGLVLAFTEKTVKLDLKKIANILLSVMAALSVLMLLFIIVSLEGFDGIAAGSFVMIVVSVGALIAVQLLGKKFE